MSEVFLMCVPPICDFCSTVLPPNPAFNFRAERAKVIDELMPPLNIDQDWFACPPCAILIKAGEWERLLHRSTTLIAQKNNIPPHLAQELMNETRKNWREIFGDRMKGL